jgi:hypothetical protein
MLEYIKTFFGSFQDVVHNVNEFGPVALGILLLCVILLIGYMLTDLIKTSRLAQIVAAGVVVAFVGFMGMSFVYWFHQSPLPKHFLRGKFTYHIPPPATAGDLDIRLRGENHSGVGGQAEAIYEYILDTREEKRLFSISKYDTVTITIRNRPLFRECDPELQGKLGTRSDSYRTQYEIALDKAYLAARDYYLAFDYARVVAPDGKAQDVLRVGDARNIDLKKISINVKHAPDRCLSAEDNGQFFRIADRGVAELLSTTASRLIAGRAHASDDKSAELVQRLGASDRSLSARAIAQISVAPASHLDVVAGLIKSGNAEDAPALINALSALQDAAPKPYRLPDDMIRELLRKSYTGTQPVRVAARDYLRDTGIVDAGIIKLAGSHLADVGPSLKGKSAAGTNFDQYYLLLITARDIYYNAGVRSIVDYRGDYGKRDRIPDAMGEAEARFKLGVDLIAAAPAGRKSSFAKAYYGMALAQFSKAVMRDAERAKGARAGSKQIQDYITAKHAANAPLPFDDAERAAFLATIERFFETIAGHETDYFWKNHIQNLSNCRVNLVYTCLSAPS